VVKERSTIEREKKAEKKAQTTLTQKGKNRELNPPKGTKVGVKV